MALQEDRQASQPPVSVAGLLALILIELAGLIGFLVAMTKSHWVSAVLFFITFACARYRTNQLGRETEHQYRDRFGPPK